MASTRLPLGSIGLYLFDGKDKQANQKEIGSFLSLKLDLPKPENSL
jgi:hypothetical protein